MVVGCMASVMFACAYMGIAHFCAVLMAVVLRTGGAL
jgi:hypothetical protein